MNYACPGNELTMQPTVADAHPMRRVAFATVMTCGRRERYRRCR